jgi:peptide/nickel transport system substrate-binding protein
MRFIYDSLVGLNDAGELDPAWGLAESWEMAPSGQQWTFKLKQGIKFHNGAEFTAADMKFTIGKLMQPESVAAYKDRLTAFIGNVEQDVQTPDPNTLVVNLSQPSIWFQWDLTDSQGLLGMPQPKAYTEEVGDEEFASNPVGTGPYRFVEQRIGDFMELEAVQDHRREGTPAIKTVIFRKITEESTRIAALRTNEVDTISVSRENVPDVRESGSKVFTQEGASVVGFYFHQQWDPVPIADERVRKALNLAVNRDELCEFVFGGLCRPGIVYPVPNNMPVTQGLKEPYPYDPEQAQQLLKEAGHESGLEITINSYPRADVPEGPRMIEALAGYFEAIGVKANILATEYTKYREARLAKTIPGQMGYLGAPMRPFPGFIGLMRSLNHSEGNFTSTKDPELDRLIQTTETTLDPQEAEETYREYYNYLYDHYIHLTLLDLDIPYATNDNVPDDWNLSVRSWEPNWLDITRPR